MARREQNTSQGFKNTSQGFKNTSQNPKTLPRIQNTSENSKTLPRIQTCFGFWEVFWLLRCVFGFWFVFWILGCVFGFLDVFWILGSVLERFVPMSHGTEVFTYSHNMTLSPKKHRQGFGTRPRYTYQEKSPKCVFRKFQILFLNISKKF